MWKNQDTNPGNVAREPEKNNQCEKRAQGLELTKESTNSNYDEEKRRQDKKTSACFKSQF